MTARLTSEALKLFNQATIYWNITSADEISRFLVDRLSFDSRYPLPHPYPTPERRGAVQSNLQRWFPLILVPGRD